MIRPVALPAPSVVGADDPDHVKIEERYELLNQMYVQRLEMFESLRLERETERRLAAVEETDPEATAKVEAMWKACGARVTYLSVDHHDEILAATSHVPHMLAFGLVDALSRMNENNEVFRYTAGGFRDFTRIASSNPVMWRDICMANAPALSRVLMAFTEEMGALARMIEARDGDGLLEIFEKAKQTRDRFVSDD